MRAAVDVMGGDKAPEAVLRGCWDAVGLLDGHDTILLVGDEAIIRPAFEAAGLAEEHKPHFKIVHASQAVAMDESPVEAVRGKPDSSISVCCKLVSKGEADVFISAGNTGACVAAAQLRMRNLPGIARPGIAVVIPTFYGPVVLCDAGANIQPQPRHIQQYGIMASAYSHEICGIDKPRVGLISIGEEDAKGTSIVKASRKLMRDEPQINFVGNVEGRDIFKGVVDVVVCDGFVGNVVLKLAEGLYEGLFMMLAAELKAFGPELIEQFKPVMKLMHAKHDWQEYGGAPLLGVNGHTIICHGASGERAITNAIRQGKSLVDTHVNEKIIDAVAKSIPAEE